MTRHLAKGGSLKLVPAQAGTELGDGLISRKGGSLKLVPAQAGTELGDGLISRKGGILKAESFGDGLFEL